MAVAANQISVGTSATLILAAQNTGFPVGREGPLVNRRKVTVTNTSAGTVYLGSSGVTTATGYPLAQNASVTLDLYPDESLYGIVASGTSTVPYVVTGS